MAKTNCPITRDQFRTGAKALPITISGQTMLAEPKEFSTGSLGWYLNGKVVVDVNGEVTIKYAEDGVKYVITGTKDDGRVVPSSIEIDDNGKTVKAESLEKLDKEYRATVEKLLKRVR